MRPFMVDGLLTSEAANHWQIRQTVGYFQNPDNQIVATTVEEDVAFGPENLGIPSVEIRRRVDEALKLVGIYDYRQHTPHLLSGGQKQRVAIAGVLAMQPRCLVLDEPTAMLDPRGRREVMDTVRRLNREEGITVIFITHFMEEAVYADRVIVLGDGKLFFKERRRKHSVNLLCCGIMALTFHRWRNWQRNCGRQDWLSPIPCSQ